MNVIEQGTDELVGHIAYVDPTKQWGYLHGALGQRVYFHVGAASAGIGRLQPGVAVRYRIASGSDPRCATQIVRWLECA